jgi:hypothetical protein
MKYEKRIRRTQGTLVRSNRTAGFTGGVSSLFALNRMNKPPERSNNTTLRTEDLQRGEMQGAYTHLGRSWRPPPPGGGTRPRCRC